MNLTFAAGPNVGDYFDTQVVITGERKLKVSTCIVITIAGKFIIINFICRHIIFQIKALMWGRKNVIMLLALAALFKVEVSVSPKPDSV